MTDPTPPTAEMLDEIERLEAEEDAAMQRLYRDKTPEAGDALNRAATAYREKLDDAAESLIQESRAAQKLREELGSTETVGRAMLEYLEKEALPQMGEWGTVSIGKATVRAIGAVAREREKLRERVGRLEAALRPFAEAVQHAKNVPGSMPQDHVRPGLFAEAAEALKESE